MDGTARKTRLKYAATINDEALPEDTAPEFEMQYLDIGNVDSDGGIQGIATHRFEEAPSRARRIARNGDVIVSTVRTYLQAIAPIQSPPDNLIVSTGFAVVRPRRGRLSAEFCKFSLREPSFLAQVEMRSVGVSYPAINSSDLGDISIYLPTIERQDCIAAFLNTEVRRIDQLLIVKQLLLELLAEKRRALITHAVTRGLDPNAPLRDSGLPWLGHIPAHWSLERLRFHLSGIEQGWSPQCDNAPADDGEWGVMRAGCVNGWDFDPTENKRLPDSLEPIPAYEIQSGDVLMSRANTTALLGSTALVGPIRPKLMLCDKLYRLNVDEARLSKSYLVTFLKSAAGRHEFERDASGASSSMQNIGQDSVRNVSLPVPPMNEQLEVDSHVRMQTKRLDDIRSATEHTITLLKERRAALIAAAVTGQLVFQEPTRTRTA